MARRKEGRQILYGVDTRQENHLQKCYDYLCQIGIHWFNATEIIGRYAVVDIREAVLTLKHTGVNVAQRHQELLSLLKGKEHEVWRK